MARYIDLEELARRINDNIKPETLEERALIEWCKDECIRQGYAMPTADVAPKSEVEVLEAELSRYTENLMQMREQDKRNLAREIFAELESKIKNDMDDIAESINSITDSDAIDGQYEEIATLEWVLDFVAELKKKYAEGET